MAEIGGTLEVESEEMDPLPVPWGKLVSVNSNLENVNLFQSVYRIGRLESNEICISDIRISGVHCTLKKGPDNEVMLEDNSSNGTYIENQKVGKGISKRLLPGKKFFILHKLKVAKQEDVLGYILSLNVAADYLKRTRDGKKEEAEADFDLDYISKQAKNHEEPDSRLSDEVKCAFCKNCIHKCVTTLPCLHNFCSACYSDCMEKSILCPACRTEVVEIKRNAFMDNIIRNFLEKNPSWRRTTKEYQEMDKMNKISHNILVLQKLDEEEEEDENDINEDEDFQQTDSLKSKLNQYSEFFQRFTAG